MKLTKEQIRMAVRFWVSVTADVIRYQLDTPDRQDPNSFMMERLAGLGGNRWTSEQRERFCDALFTLLEDADIHSLSVDYDPCPVLTEAMQKAGTGYRGGTTAGWLPFKTITWFEEDGSVTVKYGYAAPRVRIRNVSEMDRYVGIERGLSC